MDIFRNTVFCAVVAGLLAGLAMALMQNFTTVPLIFQAEAYENAGPAEHVAPSAENSAAPAAQAAHEDPPGAAAHEHDVEAWSPADGFERTAYTVGVNLVTGIGWALLLVVASEFAGGIQSWRQGVLWGLAGFAVFTLAPGLGLPPNMPGMPAAELFPRQAWWAFAAAGTAAGLAMIVFRGTIVWSLVGLALIVAPHAFGAPQPVSYDTGVPEGLHQQFIVTVTMISLVFWVILGGLVGLMRNRFFGADAPLEGKFA